MSVYTAANTVYSTIAPGLYPSVLANGYGAIPVAVVSQLSDRKDTIVPYTSVVTLYGPGDSGPFGYFSNGMAYKGTASPPASTTQVQPASSNGQSQAQSSAVPTSQPAQTTAITTTGANGVSTTIAAVVSPSAAATQNTSSAAPTASSASSAHDNRLSGEAVGGIAVACIIGGALIAGLLVWFLMRRRTKHYRNIANQANNGSWSPGPEKGISSSISPIAGGPDTSFLGGILPMGADDKEIKQRVSGTLEAAAIHVDNFYDNIPVIASPEEQMALAKFDSAWLDGSVNELLVAAKTPKAVITRALTETLVASIRPETPPGRCLLPAELSALPRSLKGTGTGTTLGQNSSALFWWRHLSTHLTPSIQQNQTYLDARAQTIAVLINDFEVAFKPWRKSKYSDKQEIDALTGTFSYAAETGIWLFGQRSGFEFIWTDKVPQGEIETRPALIKVTDANGQPLAKPRSIVQRHLERL